MEEEKIVIHCPNCSSSKLLQGTPEMTVDREYIFCSKCGLVLRLTWIMETAEKIFKFNTTPLPKQYTRGTE